MTTAETYRALLEYYCPIFFCSTIVMQSLLLYFIIFHTSARMGIFRYILGHTSVCQLMLLFIFFFCQFRMISSNVPVEIRVYGPFRHYGSLFNYALHQAFQFWLFMSGMSIIVTLYFKLMTFNWKKMSMTAMVITFLVFHVPVAFSGCLEIYLVLTVALPQDIQDYYAAINADSSIYSVVGTLRLQAVSFVNFMIMVGSVFLYPPAALAIRWKILKHLGHHLNSFSAHNKAQHRSFVTGLTVQSMLPFIMYFPMFLLYVICVFTKAEIFIQQYGIYVMPTLPALLDPFVTLFFVVPYRKQIAQICGLDKETSVAPTSVSTINMS